jgi:2-polyprenyl-3-methyl-5-hydroxy-6-metoxy-1,4-benzoquinol methylase
VDLGDGLITPGDYDFRSVLSQFQFPADMTGMDVLDVGSATGYFAFEFEKRGARVVAVDLPSLADWDIVHVEKNATLASFVEWHKARNLEEVTQLHLEGPFQFCRKALNSKVKRCHSTIYDLFPGKLGVQAFDLIFAGDVLCHIFSPLQALDRLASLCRGTLVLTQEIINADAETRPLLHYVGGEEKECTRGWWRPNLACLVDMLRKVGFQKVAMIGSHRGIVRREWIEYERAIIQASK